MISREEDIKRALEILKNGGVILYPTDTIWGIGCDATNEEAVRRVARIKNRPEQKSFIILFGSTEMLHRFMERASHSREVEVHHTDRPTTYILSGITGVAPSLVRNDGTVGVRIPDDPFCRELIGQLGVPLVSTSANFAGTPPPSCFDEIDPSLHKIVDYVVQWKQKDRTPARPSRIVKILPDGQEKIIRE